MLIGNTAKDILAVVHRLGRSGTGPTILDVVYAIYPQTKQPLKKCKTFGGYTRKLVKAGHLREVDGRYYVTSTSRAAYHAKLGTPMFVAAKPIMRLVVD